MHRQVILAAVALVGKPLALGEVGTYMARNVQLERSLDIAVRDVRLGSPEVATHEGLKDRICTEAFLISDCRDNLLLELVTFGAVGSFGGGVPSFVNRIASQRPANPVRSRSAS